MAMVRHHLLDIWNFWEFFQIFFFFLKIYKIDHLIKSNTLTKFQYLLIYWNKNHAPFQVPPSSALNRLPSEINYHAKYSSKIIYLFISSCVLVVCVQITWFDKSSTWAFNTELLWLFSVEPLLRPCFAAAVGGTRAVGGVTILGVALATMKFPINIFVCVCFFFVLFEFNLILCLIILLCKTKIQRETEKERKDRTRIAFLLVSIGYFFYVCAIVQLWDGLYYMWSVCILYCN